MELRSYYRLVTFGVKVPFGAFNGIEPYTFEVVPDPVVPANGTITSDGIYTAGNKEGVDTIKVTDSTDEVATYRISVGAPLKIVSDIISKFMGLGADQVTIYNSKRTPPKDSRLYVSIVPLTGKVFGSSNRSINGFEEIGLNVFEPLDITIFSKTNEALLRKEEVVMALKSSYSQKQQEINSLYVSGISDNIVPLTMEEGNTLVYAFNISANIQYVTRKRQATDYFDTFADIEITTNP